MLITHAFAIAAMMRLSSATSFSSFSIRLYGLLSLIAVTVKLSRYWQNDNEHQANYYSCLDFWSTENPASY